MVLYMLPYVCYKVFADNAYRVCVGIGGDGGGGGNDGGRCDGWCVGGGFEPLDENDLYQLQSHEIRWYLEM